MTFSFTSFLSNNGGNNSGSTRGSAALNRPTPRQQQYYIDLCERKRIKPKDINSFTFDTLRAEIEQMRAMPDPASPRQIEKIRELEKEIIELGGELKPITEKFINSLTGGREGSASSFIQTLFDMRTSMNDVAKPSDAQLQIMVEWFLCPDIPFEQYGVEKRVYLEHLSSYSTDVDTPDKLEQRLWRYVTPTEFAQRISERITRKDASAFIDRYRGVFYEWRKTRVTQQQVRYIRELEDRLSNTYVPPQVEYAVVDGEVMQVTKPSSRIQYNAQAYTPMEEMQLAQMSYEQGSEWIDRLKNEVDRRNTYQNMHDEVEDVFGSAQQDFEDKMTMRDENRRANDLADAKIDEFNKMKDLVFSVEAVLGYNNDEIHDMIQEMLMEDCESTTLIDYKSRIKEFFLSTVTSDQEKDNDRWTQEMARIFNMCEEVPTAMEILMS